MRVSLNGTADFIRQRLQLLGGQILRGDVDKIALAGKPVPPPMRFRRRIAETLKLAQRFGQHRRVVFGIDHRVSPTVVNDQRRRQFVVAETAAALPVHGFADAAGIVAVDNFFQARDDMGMAVLAQLDHDPAAAHFVRNCTGGTGAGEGVED